MKCVVGTCSSHARHSSLLKRLRDSLAHSVGVPLVSGQLTRSLVRHILQTACGILMVFGIATIIPIASLYDACRYIGHWMHQGISDGRPQLTSAELRILYLGATLAAVLLLLLATCSPAPFYS